MHSSKTGHSIEPDAIRTGPHPRQQDECRATRKPVRIAKRLPIWNCRSSNGSQLCLPDGHDSLTNIGFETGCIAAAFAQPEEGCPRTKNSGWVMVVNKTPEPIN